MTDNIQTFSNQKTKRTAVVDARLFDVFLTLTYDDNGESYVMAMLTDTSKGDEGRSATISRAQSMADEFASGQSNAREIYARLRPLGQCEYDCYLSGDVGIVPTR